MGKLVIKVICGRNLKGSDFMSEADGYIKLTIGSKTFRTKAVNNDANPNWNETFSFFVSEAACDNLKLELWDANTFKDDLLSNVVVPLNDLVKDTRILKRVQFPDGKGEVHIELLADFGLPPGSVPPSQQQQGYGMPPQQQQQQFGGYVNPYVQQQQPGGYVNPYAQQQTQQPQQYNFPGQNPYAANPYLMNQQQQPQPQVAPMPQPGTGAYPGVNNYLPGGSATGYSNPYAHIGHSHLQQQQQQPQTAGGAYSNPYASQYPGAAGGGAQPLYGYPAPQQPQYSPQPGGLGFLPPTVGGQNYY